VPEVPPLVPPDVLPLVPPDVFPLVPPEVLPLLPASGSPVTQLLFPGAHTLNPAVPVGTQL